MDTILVNNLVDETGAGLSVYFSTYPSYACLSTHARYRFDIPDFYLQFNLEGLKSIVHTDDELRFIVWHEVGHYIVFKELCYRDIALLSIDKSLLLEKIADSIAASHTSIETALNVLKRILYQQEENGWVDSYLKARIKSLRVLYRQELVAKYAVA